jgi:hypothetical protein
VRAALAGAAIALVLAALASQPVRAGGATFAVQGVEAGDTLNLRQRADPRSRVLVRIPPEATGLEATGRTAQVGSARWREVEYRGTHGWVNARFLAPVAATKAAEAPAAEPEPMVEREPVAAREPVAEHAPVAATAASDDLDARLVCYLDGPLWRLEIEKGGRATCTETCGGPSGLHATTPAPAEGRPGAWTMKLLRPGGAAFMTVSVKRTDSCTEDLSSTRYAYEVAARRPSGRVFRGCCNPLSDGPR